jgi:integration host factor subunit beta
MSQTRSDLVMALALRFPFLGIRRAETVVSVLLETLSTALIHKRRIELRGFGSFMLKYYEPKMGRNPKSGQAVAVPAYHAARFKLGKPLQIALNTSNTLTKSLAMR